MRDRFQVIGGNSEQTPPNKSLKARERSSLPRRLWPRLTKPPKTAPCTPMKPGTEPE